METTVEAQGKSTTQDPLGWKGAALFKIGLTYLNKILYLMLEILNAGSPSKYKVSKKECFGSLISASVLSSFS